MRCHYLIERPELFRRVRSNPLVRHSMLLAGRE
jgi:hypothetical protein